MDGLWYYDALKNIFTPDEIEKFIDGTMLETAFPDFKVLRNLPNVGRKGLDKAVEVAKKRAGLSDMLREAKSEPLKKAEKEGIMEVLDDLLNFLDGEVVTKERAPFLLILRAKACEAFAFKIGFQFQTWINERIYKPVVRGLRR